ncbi:hypothetical protein JCM30394_12790 [Deferrisoma palaeochoriense]
MSFLFVSWGDLGRGSRGRASGEFLPRWMGPYSPARGTRSGFRFHGGKLGAWVESDDVAAFWEVEGSEGAERLTELVLRRWGGGRVLFLPFGLVVKPLPGGWNGNDDDVGKRVLLGVYDGPLVLRSPWGERFDVSDPSGLEPGDPWPGPTTIGLECVLKQDGSLRCYWSHPTRSGSETVSEILRGPDAELYRRFRTARPGDVAGRVRVCAGGVVLTNRRTRCGDWESVYLGRVSCEVEKSQLVDWIKRL